MNLISLNSACCSLSLCSVVSSVRTSRGNFLTLSPPKLSLTFPQIGVFESHSDSVLVNARKRSSASEQKPFLNPNIIDQVSLDDEDDFLFDQLDDEEYDDFDYAEDEHADDAEASFGDGEAGGGICLAGTWWDKKALELAEEVSRSFDGELNIYAFKTLSNSAIRVRIENLSVRSGSPSIEDIEAFTTTYRARLDEAEVAKSIPENVYLEVSSPGVERVVRIPQDLDRFKERAMYVKYVSETGETGSSSEGDGVFRLVSYDPETQCCSWGLADVRVNREKAGKGRPLSKKQRDWRLDTPFESLHMVRLYSEI